MQKNKTKTAISYWNEQTNTDKDILCRLKYGEKKSYKRLTNEEIVKIVYND